jgi:putative restriction endonuclease
VKGVFTTRIDSHYDDAPEQRYHFPRRYLDRVQQTVGDLIVYYEPRRNGGRQVYFATAQVNRIEEDSQLSDHFYAYVDPPTFLQFPRAVPFREAGGTYEQALSKADASTNRGAFGNAVRLLQPGEYEAVLAAGMAPIRDRTEDISFELAEEQETFERPVRETVLNRKVRDRAFMALVRDAYDSTCAFTGLRLINGGGRSEIEAAHIQPVGGGHAGPDSVRNGLALSRTLHWMFDRGLMSLEDDGRILLAKRRGDDALDRVQRLLHPDGRATLPADVRLRPHGRFLRYHREAIFKG